MGDYVFEAIIWLSSFSIINYFYLRHLSILYNRNKVKNGEPQFEEFYFHRYFFQKPKEKRKIIGFVSIKLLSGVISTICLYLLFGNIILFYGGYIFALKQDVTVR